MEADLSQTQQREELINVMKTWLSRPEAPIIFKSFFSEITKLLLLPDTNISGLVKTACRYTIQLLNTYKHIFLFNKELETVINDGVKLWQETINNSNIIDDDSSSDSEDNDKKKKESPLVSFNIFSLLANNPVLSTLLGNLHNKSPSKPRKSVQDDEKSKKGENYRAVVKYADGTKIYIK